MLTLGFSLALLIGLSLGLLGGGGSTLTVPILVYVVGFGAKEAIATSLVVVGAVSVVGAIGHRRAGHVRARIALGFGAIAMGFAYVGARLASFLSGAVQLLLFAALMLFAAWRMLGTDGAAAYAEADANSDAVADRRMGAARGRPRESAAPGRPEGAGRLAQVAAAGAGVGILTGLLGVGGGFLIVPALVLLAGLSMKEAVGTSLVVIAMNCVAGFAGYLGQVEIRWTFTALFAGVAILGILAGTRLVRFVSQTALRRAFAVFLIVMGCLILYQNRSAILPTEPATRAARMTQAGPTMRADRAESAARPARAGTANASARTDARDRKPHVP